MIDKHERECLLALPNLISALKEIGSGEVTQETAIGLLKEWDRDREIAKKVIAGEEIKACEFGRFEVKDGE